ncbi:YtkA-like [Bacillus sp. OV322]|uniref:FixH family protein n=1 Tax=Bacillus sp. OV322 TaxID=1882764 RepID=UPI0008F013A6|nr:FixH family protein [Bacillus sp. OV322]SFC77185.1 YtkA-like [Bacillus sp. OV322]
MKKISLCCLIGLLLLVGGCSGNKQEMAEDMPNMLDVKVTINPEIADVNKTVDFKADIVSNGKRVKKADEVKFEIWNSQINKHTTIEVHPNEKGDYEIKKTFSAQGTYYIIAHVTAEGMHAMPKKEFTIGSRSSTE